MSDASGDQMMQADETRSISIALHDLPSLAGRRIGVSRWHAVTQQQVNLFADATGDHQWIHVDPERARKGPFGGTIVHGYLTLSLASIFLLEGLLEVSGVAQVINYGLGRVRFPAPLPVGSEVRLVADCAAVEEVRGGYQMTIDGTFERAGGGKPVCTAEILFRYYAG